MGFQPPLSSALGPPIVRPLTDQDRVIESDPMSGGQKVNLTERQSWANTEDFQKNFPVHTAYWKYRGPGYDDNAGTPMQYGRAFRDWLRKPNALSSVLNSGTMPAALGMGLGAGALALGGSAVKNMLSDDEHKTNTFRNTLLAMLAGGALGGWLGHNRMSAKQAYYNFGSDSGTSLKEQVLAELADARIPAAEKFQYMAAVPQLGSGDLRQLLQLLGVGGGAALGAALARFFLGRGALRATAGALLGGLGARAFTSRGSQRMIDTDFHGNPYRPL